MQIYVFSSDFFLLFYRYSPLQPEAGVLLTGKILEVCGRCRSFAADNTQRRTTERITQGNNMAEELKIKDGSKEEKYLELIPQIMAVVENEEDVIANMANVASMIHETFGFWWTGFYRVRSSTELVLGPFQGPLACTRIRKGKGVCGTAWQREATVVVEDVDKFEGHIACSSASKSEIVVPVIKDNEVVAVLDIDSAELNTFDEVDQKYLENIVKLL